MPPQPPNLPPGVLTSNNNQSDLERIVAAVADAKRVIVVCGRLICGALPGTHTDVRFSCRGRYLCWRRHTRLPLLGGRF